MGTFSLILIYLIMDLLIITRVNDFPENLKVIGESIKEEASKVKGFSYKWLVIININRQEFISSRAIKLVNELNGSIIYSHENQENVLNEAISNISNAKFVHILEETNKLYPDSLIEFSRHMGRDLILFQQLREDGNVYPKSLANDILPTAAGVIDFGQVFFKLSTLKDLGGFDISFAASGRTVDKFIKSNATIFYHYATGSYRNRLSRTTTSSKPKVFVKNLPNVKVIGDIEVIPCSEVSKFDRNSCNVTELNEGKITYHDVLSNVLNSKVNKPSVSIYTSAYNIGDRILQTFESVKSQTYSNFEWVIVNDSCDGGKTQEILEQMQEEDPRVRVYQFTKRSRGNIGEAKFRAVGLCEGELLVELDHDDLLHPRCLEYLVNAATKVPSAGFFYSDCVELDEYYNCPKYPEGFALGFGSYRTDKYIALDWEVQNTVPTNPWTIRHIVGVPNHVRCWRKDVYYKAMQYNRHMTIADDYELIVRTFLVTKFCRIPKLLYFQRFDGNNSQDNGNRSDIQLRVAEISNFYKLPIKKRFEELGIKDVVFDRLDKVPFLWAIPPENGYDVNLIYEEK